MTLTEFVLARIAEDEALAIAATPGPWTHEADDTILAAEPHPASVMTNGFGVDLSSRYVAQTSEDDSSATTYNSEPDAEHIARHHPGRVLADCAARRQIIGWHGRGHECPRDDNSDLAGWFGDETEPCPTLLALASPHADHPDYEQDWRL